MHKYPSFSCNALNKEACVMVVDVLVVMDGLGIFCRTLLK